jgi:hypothetical protein
LRRCSWAFGAAGGVLNSNRHESIASAFTVRRTWMHETELRTSRHAFPIGTNDSLRSGPEALWAGMGTFGDHLGAVVSSSRSSEHALTTRPTSVLVRLLPG